MKRLLLAALLVGASAYAQTDKEVADARAATERWIKLMDAEEFSAAWNSSATGLRKDVPKLAWNLMSSTLHLPLGSLKSRSLRTTEAKPAKIAFTYLADYEKSHNVRETYTATLEADGVWRISGYNINSDGK